MVDVQRAGATARSSSSAMPTSHATATPSPSTSSATSSVHGDDAYGAISASTPSAAYRSAFKDDDTHDLTEGEESLYGGSISSPYLFGAHLGTPQQQQHTPQQQQQRDDDEFFASYTGTPQPSDHHHLDDSMRAAVWEYYPPYATGASGPPPLPPASPAPLGTAAPTQQLPSRFPSNLPTNRFPITSSAFPTASSLASTSASSSTTSTNVLPVASSRQGIKRPLERVSSSSSMASPTVSVASSMLAMRNHPDALDLTQSSQALLTAHTTAAASQPTRETFAPPRNTINLSTNTIHLSGSSAVSKRPTAAAKATTGRTNKPVKHETADVEIDDVDDVDATLEPAAKKTKVSRERQLKINAASRRCRKKQKLELQFLRTHVVDLQHALKEQVSQLSTMPGQQLRAARLGQLLDESLHKVDEMSSGVRPATPAVAATASKSASESDAITRHAAATSDDRSGDDTDRQSAGSNSSDNRRMNTIEVDDVRGVHAIDPMTGYHLSDERKRTLLNIASFVRVNMSLESRSFSPEVISCLPIEMDGWQLRLSITEKNYTIHNAKFFPCDLMDMYDFCWETNVSQKISIKQGKKHYSVVTPLDSDVAHVYSKTIGKWSLAVHGVPNVSYNSLVCRRYEPEQRRALICQQSVLEERDFEDESTLPWLFKRWVVFQPHVVDGVHGTLVEAYRTASYATGKLIYKENNTYDSFCEHLIRRIAESNSLLERTMARDHRFQHIAAATGAEPLSELDLDYEETASDRMVKDLLLF